MILSRQASRSGLGWKGIALTGAVSIAAHGAVLAALIPPSAEIEIAGGAASAPAALGSDFRDYTQGAIPTSASAAPSAPPQPAPTPAQPVTAEASPATPTTVPPALAAEASPATPMGLVATGAAPNTPLAALEAPSLLPRAALTVPTAPVPATPSDAAAPALAQPVTPTAPQVQPPAPILPQAQASEPERLEPAPEPEITVRSADASTTRPPQRPDFEARARAEAAQEAAREAAREEARQQAAAAQPAGDSDRSARRGSSDGSNGQAAASAPQPAAQASAAGNAAALNYPGQVMRRIQRVRQARVRARGSAVVAFSIAANGGLASASLARRSGSAELDQAALDHIRRAAPFPAPPAGAQRNFSFEFVGR